MVCYNRQYLQDLGADLVSLVDSAMRPWQPHAAIQPQRVFLFLPTLKTDYCLP